MVSLYMDFIRGEAFWSYQVYGERGSCNAFISDSQAQNFSVKWTCT